MLLGVCFFLFTLLYFVYRVTKKQIWKKVRQKIGDFPPSIDWDLVTDRFIEPIIWIVDNFSGYLGTVSYRE